MKRKLLAMFALPVMFTTGCDEATIKQILDLVVPFSGEVQLYKDVVGDSWERSVTRHYVAYDGQVFEVEELAPTANTDTETHCVISEEDVLSTSSSSFQEQWGKFVKRYVGTQTAWVVRDPNSGDNNWEHAPIGANESLDDADLWYVEPEFNTYDWAIFFNDQRGNYNNFLSDTNDLEDYTQYWYDLLVEPVELFYYEEASYYRWKETSETITRFNDVVTTAVSVGNCCGGSYASNFSNDFSSSLYRELRTVFDGWLWGISEWAISDVDNVYTSGIDAWVIVPDGVKVGDTWISNYNFASAITTQELTMEDGVTIETLVIVERGTREFDVANADVVGECVDFYNSVSEATEGATQPPSYVELNVKPFNCNGNAELDFVNEVTYWYFAGIVLKEVRHDRSVEITQAGYARLNPDTGICEFYYADWSNDFYLEDLPWYVEEEEIEEYKPYVYFQVTEWQEGFTATQIRDTNVLLEQFEAEFGDAITTTAPSDTTDATDATTDTTE